MSGHNILILDDQEENLSSTKDLLHRWGYKVDAVTTGTEAIENVKSGAKNYAVALLDYCLADKTGTEVGKEIRAIDSEVVLLVYSAYPSVESLTATLRAGVLNFIDKNEDLSALKAALETACKEYEKVRRIKPPLSLDEASTLIASLGMVGRSAKLAYIAEQVKKYKESPKPVLILGETGVGKEMIAKALHKGRSETFFPINCAAFNESSLVESELFGHEKGAFTGAVMRKVGILEQAKGGTVYLDEIHHLDLKIQARLLRCLREKKIRRVGGTSEEAVDFKLVVSSWPDIEKRVENGSVLPDLYYRINFLCIGIPALRERPEDIEPLVAHFSERYFQDTGVRKHFLVRTIRHLEKFDWPGNVGELDGIVSALLTDSDHATIDESQLNRRMKSSRQHSLDTFAQLETKQLHEKREFIQSAIDSSKSIVSAAQKMGMKETSLHTLMNRLGIRKNKDEAATKLD